MESRTCLACEKPLVRNPGEQTSHWEKRLTCNYSCHMTRLWRERRAEVSDKECPICGQTFGIKPGQKPATFKRNQHCSRKCATEHSRRAIIARHVLPEKWCVVCGVRLELRDRSQSQGKEHIASFKARKTCGPECAAGLVSRQKIAHNADIRATPYPPKFTDALKRSIRDRDNHTCQWCGNTEGERAFDVHHIDYNKENCTKGNLITLCRTCHRKTTFGDRGEWMSRLSGLLFERVAA